MHEYDLILTVTGGLGAALVLGYVTQRIGLSPIVGYLLAGTLVGPHTPGFVADASMAEQLAEIGVILLMFGVGLQFHLDELLAVQRVAVPGAVAQSVVATALGWLLARSFGWDWSAGLVFGMALSVASTVVLVRVLADNNDLHTQAGHIAVGWLVVEDLFTVLALVLLPSLFGPAEQRTSLPAALALTSFKVAALIGFTAVVGTRVIPRVLDYVERTRSRELFTLSVLAIALGIAVGSAKIFSVSMALGAFLAGMVVGRSDYSLRAASEALPMRDAFAVLFFVSVGMLLNPASLLEAPALLAGALAVVLIGKPAVALVIVWAMRYPWRTALTVALALSQIGEFSFILATLGRGLGVLTAEATNVIVATSIVSIVLNPLLYRTIRPLERWVAAHPRLRALLDPSPTAVLVAGAPRQRPPDPAHRAIVIGYGPTGRAVVDLLRDNEIEPTVIEINIDNVRMLRESRVHAVYGDATRPETLAAAGVSEAGTIILGSAGMANGMEVIRIARQVNPKIRVLARASYLRDVPALKDAGADAVYSGEGEVALAFVEEILESLGATPEQIDRERARAHRALAPALLLAATAAAVGIGVFAAAPAYAQATAVDPIAARVDPYVEKQRVIVMTDIANEPDDQMSLVRFLVYANHFEVEGLIATTSTWMKSAVRPDVIRTVLDAYAEVHANLSQHEPGFADAATLRQVVASGQAGYGMAAVGVGQTSAGAELIVRAAERKDPRPLWVLAWGGANTLAQALLDARASRSPAQLEALVSKLRVYAISDQDDAGAWLRREFPTLHYIGVPSTADGAQYYLATWTGISGDRFYKNAPGADFTTFEDAWIDANIRSKGPLGKHYPMPCCIHEGDTPSFLGLIDNGLGSFMSPTYGGWGGRYVWRTYYGEPRPSWTQGGDSYPGQDHSRDTVRGVDGRLYTSDQATIWRWRTAFQHDFAARMDWTVKGAREANHNPDVVVNGNRGKAPMQIDAVIGTPVTLDASGTTDRDGDRLRYTWFFYEEAGRGIPGQPVALRVRPAGGTAAPGQGGIPSAPAGGPPEPPPRVTLAGETTARVTVTPRVAGTAHVILAVEDSGTPSLTSYRRVILRTKPKEL